MRYMVRAMLGVGVVLTLLVGVAWASYGNGMYWLAKGGGQWSVSIYEGDTLTSLAPMAGIDHPVLSASDITDVKALFVADPFMVRTDAGYVMFVEIYNIVTDQGDIGIATSKDGKKWQYEKIVLDEPFHLSYPCVFQWQGDYYMIPESYQANGIRLYRAKRFPDQWELVSEMIPGQFGDPTIFEHDGKWWLFAEGNQPHGNDTLRLFFADQPQGPWREHPASPVVHGNAHHARPGGRVIAFDGRLIRFAQDCKPSYGRQIWGFEITELTTTAYSETPFGAEPIISGSADGKWNSDGMHQIDPIRTPDGKWIACVDGQRHVNFMAFHR